MQIRIQLPKIMGFHANTDPHPCCKPIVRIVMIGTLRTVPYRYCLDCLLLSTDLYFSEGQIYYLSATNSTEGLGQNESLLI
jgi:hypothetical protein